MKKKCTKCGEEKDIGQFCRKTGTADGRNTICKTCKAAGDKDYRDRKKKGEAGKRAKAPKKIFADPLAPIFEMGLNMIEANYRISHKKATEEFLATLPKESGESIAKMIRGSFEDVHMPDIRARLTESQIAKDRRIAEQDQIIEKLTMDNEAYRDDYGKPHNQERRASNAVVR